MSGVLRNMDKFPSEHMLQNKFGYSRQTVRNALDRLEQDGLIARVKGSGTYVSYAPEKNKEERPRIGLILSYFSDYLFPQVYEGIESVLREEGYKTHHKMEVRKCELRCAVIVRRFTECLIACASNAA